MEATAIDLDAINREIEAGYISRQKHPTADLYIHNYTPRAQWERHWTPYTMMCRGLILNGSGDVIARPFPKFFNYEEVADQIPAEPFEVFDKLDGSLGILYRTDEGLAIATRGSFTSPQAVQATKMLRDWKWHDSLVDIVRGGWTLLFEIIYPENRIVVDYGSLRHLVLLAAIENETGIEGTYEGLRATGWPHIVQRFDGMTDIAAIKSHHRDNAEGFVLRFASGFRCKVKLAEYVRLHKLLTGITPRHIWETLRDKGNLNDYAERVPDEFYNWLLRTALNIKEKYMAIEAECIAAFRSDFKSRKLAACYITQQKYPSILFAMLDGKPYDDAIWRLVRPAAARAFRCDEEMASPTSP